MVDCPGCGAEMKIGAMQFDQPLYNCDKCNIDCYRPPKKTIKPPKPETETETKEFETETKEFTASSKKIKKKRR